MQFSATSRSIALLIIVALFLQPWFGQRAVAQASEALGTLVVCTGAGFQVISVPADVMLPEHPGEASDDPLDHSDASAANCLACLVQALGHLDGTGRIDPSSLHRYWLRETNPVDRWTAEPLCQRRLGSRGPPAA